MADIPDAILTKVATVIDEVAWCGEEKAKIAAIKALSASRLAEAREALIELGKATKVSLDLADKRLVEIRQRFRAAGLDVDEARSDEAQAAYDACKNALDKARAALQVKP